MRCLDTSLTAGPEESLDAPVPKWPCHGRV